MAQPRALFPAASARRNGVFVGLVQGPAHASGQANFPVRALQLQTCNCNPCRAQKASLWGWALGSVCTVVTECYEVVTLSNIQKKDESDEAWSARRLKAQTEINNRLVVLTHALVQVGPGGLAVGQAARQQWHGLKAGPLEWVMAAAAALVQAGVEAQVTLTIGVCAHAHPYAVEDLWNSPERRSSGVLCACGWVPVAVLCRVRCLLEGAGRHCRQAGRACTCPVL